jgi:hypothetical protein
VGHGASQQAKVRQQLSDDPVLIEPFVGKSEVTAGNGGLAR